MDPPGGNVPRAIPGGPRTPHQRLNMHATSPQLETPAQPTMQQFRQPQTISPPTPPLTPSSTIPQMAASLAPLKEGADLPPYLLPAEKEIGGTSIVLYIFRVPSTGDLCLSLVKPLRVTLTELDILLALYYVRIGSDSSMVMLRGGKPVARLEKRVLEMFGDGYHQFGFACSDDDRLVHQLGLYEDARGATTWQSPWKGHCVFSPDKHALNCEHHRSDVAASAPSAIISTLKFNLPGLASSKKLRRSVVEHREDSGKVSLGHHPLPPLPPRAQPISQYDHETVMSSFTGEHRFSTQPPPPLRVDENPPPPLPPRYHASAVFAPLPRSVAKRMSDSFSLRKENIDDSLSLGKERLGGGFLGKTAKLGKLTIWGAGQQMLDMTVATNLFMFLKAFTVSNTKVHAMSSFA